MLDLMVGIAYTISNLAKLEEIGIGEAVLKHRELHHLPVPEQTYPDSRDPVFARLINKVGDIDTHFAHDLTNGAIYYLDLNQTVPDNMKFLLKDASLHPLVASIGTKKFFK